MRYLVPCASQCGRSLTAMCAATSPAPAAFAACPLCPSSTSPRRRHVLQSVCHGTGAGARGLSVRNHMRLLVRLSARLAHSMHCKSNANVHPNGYKGLAARVARGTLAQWLHTGRFHHSNLRAAPQLSESRFWHGACIQAKFASDYSRLGGMARLVQGGAGRGVG